LFLGEDNRRRVASTSRCNASTPIGFAITASTDTQFVYEHLSLSDALTSLFG
jgi:hypothetical protein